MKLHLVSKQLVNFVYTSTAIILTFVVALILGTLDAKFVFLFLLFPALLWVIKPKSVLLLSISFLLGMMIVFMNQMISSNLLSPGCYDASVASRPKSYGVDNIFKIKTGAGLAVILTPDRYYFSDSIKFCFSESDVVAGSNTYILSQYKTALLIKHPQITFISPGRGVVRKIYDLSDQISLILARLYSGDEAVLAKGLILGGSSDFSQSTKVNLKRSGTSHIVAVSGYNVSILTVVIFDLLRQVFSKNIAGVATPIFLLIFYLLTGGSASVLRASIMGLIILSSRFIGRRVSAFHLLILAALVMLIINPFAIYDIGFLLSFGATAGIFFMSDSINKLLERIFRIKSIFIKIISETLSAQIYTLPILLSSFGLLSIVSPLSNMLILPLVPLSMLLVFVSAVLASASFNLGLLIGGPSGLLLKFFLFVINSLGSARFASVMIKIPVLLSILLYFVIVILNLYLNKIAKDEAKTF